VDPCVHGATSAGGAFEGRREPGPVAPADEPLPFADYYFDDSRVVLVPIEYLTPEGMTAEFARLVRERCGWTAERVGLFDAGFALYWARSAALARRTATWVAPRVRHVAVVREPLSVRPYVQLLNTSAWLLYESDVDPVRSHPEFLAYVLAHGDRMAVSGEVTTAAVHTAAWWLERSDAECGAFAAAAERSSRPDAGAFRALAGALGWLRELRHETLRPLVVLTPHRAIPGTGLLVPRAREAEPPALVARWTDEARRALAAYRAAWRAPASRGIAPLSAWLAETAPPLLVTAGDGRVVWDPERAADVGSLADALRDADAAAVEAVGADLAVVDRHTRAFLASLVDRAALPAPSARTEHRGYSWLHRERRLIAYDLHEPGMERLAGPPLPYALHMLGARTAHEWAHLAERAGWVPRVVAAEELAARKADVAAALDATIAAAPASLRARTRDDLRELAAGGSAGAALTRILLTRMPDYRANLVARRFMTEVERETYVRHNVRTLRPEYPPAELWRMLVRYLYEYQYLGPGLGSRAVGDPRTWLARSTWFDDDFFASGALDERGFDTLAGAVARLCAC
jgi:hypothetical protein